MLLPIQEAPLFAADIEVSFYEDDGIFILTITDLAQVIRERLCERHINSVFKPNVITGGRAKPLCELELSSEVGFDVVINEIRQALNVRNIDYYEPYTMTEESREFRFITPNISMFP